jgi:actin-related protein 8
MRICTSHLMPSTTLSEVVAETNADGGVADVPEIGDSPTKVDEPAPSTQPPSVVGTPIVATAAPLTTTTELTLPAALPAPAAAIIDIVQPTSNDSGLPSFDVFLEASKSPLDAAIAASIAMAGTDNKVKTAASAILLIGGGSAMKGMNAFLTERSVGFLYTELGRAPMGMS